LPVGTFSMWQHIYCALCTPLIRAGYERECLNLFFEWLDSEGGCALMEFKLLSADGPGQRLLDDRLMRQKHQSLVIESHARALFRAAESADHYLRAALRRDHRKDLRRRTRRLGEQGQLEFDSLERGGDKDTWTQEFLDLEARGWKGQNGGAFACNAVNKDFFVSVATAAFERGRLMMLALRLDGKPVAMKCNIVSAPGSFAFKIAFDESYSAYSPGVMLEVENIRRLHAAPLVEWMDSCATPDHPMIDRLWLDRRAIHNLIVPTGKMAGEFVISALPFIRSINRWFRGIADIRREGKQ